jgi:hypothetical protein
MTRGGDNGKGCDPEHRDGTLTDTNVAPQAKSDRAWKGWRLHTFTTDTVSAVRHELRVTHLRIRGSSLTYRPHRPQQDYRG